MQIEYAEPCFAVPLSSMRQLMGVPDRAEAGEGSLGARARCAQNKARQPEIVHKFLPAAVEASERAWPSA